MTSDVFDAWSTEAVAGLARQLVDSGSLPAAEATAYAAEQHARTLADGIATPHHHFWTALLDELPVGHLWLCVRPRGPEVESFVYDVAVVEAARGRGIGREVMLAGESAARDLGAGLMRLNVFGHNRAAMTLYDRLGYVVETAVVRLGVDREADERPRGGDVVLSHVTGDELVFMLPELERDLAQTLVAGQGLNRRDALLQAREELRSMRTGSGGTTLVLTAHVAGRAAGWFSFRRTPPAGGPRGLVQHHGPDAALDSSAARGLVHELRRVAREQGISCWELSVPGSDVALRAACDLQGAELVGQLMRKAL